jgi:hypothetical protein
MKPIRSPYLSLNFYYPDRPEYIAFAQIIRALHELGAEFLGEGIVYKRKGIRDTPFTYADDYTPLTPEQDYGRERIQFKLEDLDTMNADPDLLLSWVFFGNAVGSQPATKEELVYGDVLSPQAAQHDRHPLMINAAGSMFYFDYDKSRRAGKLAYKRLVEIVKLTQPAIAAITIEEELRCPTDLKLNLQNRAYYAFSNFYISQQFVGESKFNQISTLFQGAYHEEINDGVYISTYDMVNPKRKKFKSDEPLIKLNEKVGKIIGAAAKRLK